MGVRITIPGNPGQARKNNAAIRYTGGGFCPTCRRAKGKAFLVPAKVPAALCKSITAEAFSAGAPVASGMVMLGILAHWPTQWGPKGRANGRPRGDVDAPVSSVLDALAGVLYEDDAQVALLIAANAKAAKGTERIEVSVRELSPRLLELLTEELGLDFAGAQLSTGTQGSLPGTDE